MRFTIAAAAAAMAVGVSAQVNGTAAAGTGVAAGAGTDFQATAFDTVVVNAYVTTCPANTAFTYNGQVYSGAAGQVITVTNCPCTVTAPAGSIPSGAKTATAPAVPVATAPPTNQGNVVPVPSNDTGAKPDAPQEYTGAASKLSVAGLAAVFAIAAYAL